MTSPVSRDRLDAIRAEWADEDGGDYSESRDVPDLLAAAAYALVADDRIAALEAEVDALNARIAQLEAVRDAAAETQRRLAAERDALAATIARVRALCEEQWCHHECSTAERALAILDGAP